MATPYVVPSLPLSKSKNCENFSPLSSNKNFSHPAKNCARGCGYSCNAWCTICSSQMKHGYRNGSEFVTSQLDSPVKVSCNINSPSRRSPSPNTPSKNHHNCGDSADTVDFPRFKDANKTPTGTCVKSTPWIAVSNGVQEKYLREVEALRGKLRELRGSTPRKLPTPPTLSKLKTSHIKGPTNCAPGTYLNIDSSWSIEPPNNSEFFKQASEEKIADSKRTRFPSDPECTVTAAAEASAKRLRELSPSHFYQRLGNREDTPIGSSRRLGPAPFSPSRNSNKMGTTCVEREGGDYYTVRINRNNEVSCSMILPSSENGKLSSPSHKLSAIEKTTDVPTVAKSNSVNVGSSWDRITPEVKESRSLHGPSEPSPPLKESRSQNSQIKREPSPLPAPVVSNPTVKGSTEPLAPSTVTPDSPSHDSLGAGNNYLRPSLFSNVPPYVKFTAHNEKVEHELPKAIHKALKWKLSTITPLVVKHTVTNSGFRLVKRTGEWGGIWGRHMKSVCFKTLYDYQKINHLPGTFQIGRKDRLWKNIYKLMAKFGKKEFGFLPRTYILPQDAKILRQAWDKNSKTKWIVKPPAAARGTGIKVINKWAQVPKKTPVIVQKYISNPYLINGNKFDLRLYVLVTSFHPLKIYLYTNGLVRFASVKYSDEISTLANRYMHLTNYSINKLSNNYASNEDADACVGHKWTIKSLWSYLEGSVNVESLWNTLVDLVIKTMLCGEAPIVNLTNANLNSRYSAYELFGVDVLLDENLKPWLLEVNISPSLHSTSPLDIAVKGPMVRDILNIAGYHVPDRFNDMSKEELSKKLGVEGPLCYDSRMYVPELSPKERNKQSFFCDIADRESYLDSILDELTPDDVRHLIVYEDEITQIGSFQKVFPTTETHEYFQYFEESRYYNMLFDAWETRYHKNREEGIQLLESKCLENVHLDITEVEPQQFAYCPSDAASIKGEEAVDGDDDAASVSSGGNRLVPQNSALIELRQDGEP